MPPSSGELRPVFHVGRAAVGWAVVGVVLALIGRSKAINLLLLFGYFLLALLPINAGLSWRAVRRVAARRVDRPPVFAGEMVAHRIEVTNPSRRAVAVRVSDPAAGQPAGWFLPALPAGGADALQAEWVFPARGRYPVGPLVVESGYPFGLVRWVREVAPAGAAVVLPAPGRVDVGRLRRWLSRAAVVDGRGRRSGPGAGDLRGVRPYRPGDGPRDIHWRTSARRGQLVVREYDRADPVGLVIVLDPWTPTTPDPAAAARLEWAVGLALSVGWAWARAGEAGDLTLVVPGVPPVVASGRATIGFVRAAFAPLADLAGTPDVPAIPTGAVRGSTGRTLRLVVSTRPNGAVADGLRRAGLPAASADPAVPLRWYTPAG